MQIFYSNVKISLSSYSLLSIDVIIFLCFSPVQRIDPKSPAYEEFLVQQKKRALEWRTNREAKKTKGQYASSTDDRDNRKDTVSVLRQQLAAKTEECYELKSKLESIEAVNSQILRNQVEMQDNFFKVRFVILV